MNYINRTYQIDNQRVGFTIQKIIVRFTQVGNTELEVNNIDNPTVVGFSNNVLTIVSNYGLNNGNPIIGVALIELEQAGLVCTTQVTLFSQLYSSINYISVHHWASKEHSPTNPNDYVIIPVTVNFLSINIVNVYGVNLSDLRWKIATTTITDVYDSQWNTLPELTYIEFVTSTINAGFTILQYTRGNYEYNAVVSLQMVRLGVGSNTVTVNSTGQNAVWNFLVDFPGQLNSLTVNGLLAPGGVRPSSTNTIDPIDINNPDILSPNGTSFNTNVATKLLEVNNGKLFKYNIQNSTANKFKPIFTCIYPNNQFMYGIYGGLQTRFTPFNINKNIARPVFNSGVAVLDLEYESDLPTANVIDGLAKDLTPWAYAQRRELTQIFRVNKLINGGVFLISSGTYPIGGNSDTVNYELFIDPHESELNSPRGAGSGGIALIRRFSVYALIGTSNNNTHTVIINSDFAEPIAIADVATSYSLIDGIRNLDQRSRQNAGNTILPNIFRWYTPYILFGGRAIIGPVRRTPLSTYTPQPVNIIEYAFYDRKLTTKESYDYYHKNILPEAPKYHWDWSNYELINGEPVILHTGTANEKHLRLIDYNPPTPLYS